MKMIIIPKITLSNILNKKDVQTEVNLRRTRSDVKKGCDLLDTIHFRWLYSTLSEWLIPIAFMLYFQPCKPKSFWRSHSFLQTFHTIISQMTWCHNDVTLLNKLWVIRNYCIKSMVLAKIEMSANYSRYFMNDEVHDAESNDPFELYVMWDESYDMTHWYDSISRL